jgi:TonB family protein
LENILVVNINFYDATAMELTPLAAVSGTHGTSNDRLHDVQSYSLTIQSALGPKVLDGHGLKGRVLVAFSISANGALTSARVAQSSGEYRLDMQALQIVGRASFPTPPAGMGAMHRNYVSMFTFE